MTNGKCFEDWDIDTGNLMRCCNWRKYFLLSPMRWVALREINVPIEFAEVKRRCKPEVFGKGTMAFAVSLASAFLHP